MTTERTNRTESVPKVCQATPLTATASHYSSLPFLLCCEAKIRIKILQKLTHMKAIHITYRLFRLLCLFRGTVKRNLRKNFEKGWSAPKYKINMITGIWKQFFWTNPLPPWLVLISNF